MSAQADGLMQQVSSLDFWLDSPLRIVLILVIAALLNLVARTVIHKITAGVSKGTRARIVTKKTAKGSRWVEDTQIANERQAQRATTVGSVLRSVATIVIWVMATLMIISELGFNIAPVIASAGIAGVALSFGAQSLVKDYLAGISMVAEDQLGIGDVVDLGEASGTVESVGLRVTQVRDVEGTLWHVRNGEVLRVGNSSQGWARTVLDVPVAYNSDLDAVTQLLLKTAEEVKQTTESGKSIMGKPEVWGVEQMSGESLTLRLAVKTAPLQQWDVARTLRAHIKRALDQEGFRMPLLNQSIIHQTSSFPSVSARVSPSSGEGESASRGS
ncbi:mechanosensitive ion channel family protein [Rothia sp. AR01]|uniref:Mechanosensitive ion channel family protein n=1 Tax=Rothia santali TaxID=2949643 RepID=A0A9X2HHA9_9MICC|nr:mechanosensitive ion channel family protein [Rothia santali]MCP3424848.1 mechanosensitive ion channel family protein [Rothia santali]